MSKIICCLFAALVFAIPISGQSQHKLLRKGDRQFDLEHYQESEKYYRDAADRRFGDPRTLYNLGSSLYQQGKWEEAATRFEQSSRLATDKGLKADAFHNLGNTQLKQQKYKDAIAAYESSLRLRPGDADTKQNLQMAKKKLKEEEQRQKKQQQKENQPDQNQDQQKDQQQNQDQQDQNRQNGQQPQQQPDQQQNRQQQQQNQGQSQEPQNLNQQQNADKIKKEEAQRLLKTAIEPEDRKNARKYREQQPLPKSTGKEKDW